MGECTPPSPNVRAFLKLLRFAENRPRDDDELYYRLFGGGTFTDTRAHPNKLVTIGKYSSTAAGAYQLLYKTWLRAKQDGVVADFSPASQDTIAFEKLRSHLARQDVCDGEVESAIAGIQMRGVMP